MEPWVQTVLAVFASVMASTGLWAYLLGRKELKNKEKEKEEEKKSAKNRMLLGLGHDRIITLCMQYLERGYITQDEYEDMDKYLYKPYRDMGGNGTAEKLMDEVSRLPVKSITHIQELRRKQRRGFFSRMLGYGGNC